LTMVVLFLPVPSFWYCGLYIFPMIILYFSTLDERSNIFNTYILVSFIFIINPLQIPVKYSYSFININYILANILLLLLWMTILILSIRKIFLPWFRKEVQ
jgi:hypothetical protein